MRNIHLLGLVLCSTREIFNELKNVKVHGLRYMRTRNVPKVATL